MNKKINKNKKTHKEFVEEVYNLYKNEYEILGEYINAKTKILIKHNCVNCNNHEWNITPNNFLRGKKCPICFGKIKKDEQYFKNKLYELNNDEYILLSEYKNTYSKVLIKHNCDKCNNYEWYIRPNKILSGTKCPKCANVAKKTHSEFLQEVFDLVGNEYAVIGEYKNAHEKILVQHNCIECGNFNYYVEPNNFIKNRRCPSCKNSKGEKIIFNFLTKNNILFIQEYKYEELKSDMGFLLRFDFAILNKSNCIISLIEYDGEGHYNKNAFGEKSYETIIYHDKLKDEYCKKNNIKLIRIPYWDFDNIEKILNNELKEVLINE